MQEFEKYIKGNLDNNQRKYVMNQTRRDITLKVMDKAELGIVKKGTSKELLRYVGLYVHLVNKEKAYNYLGDYRIYGILKEYENSRLPLVDLIRELKKQERELEKERYRNLLGIMKEIYENQ